MDSLTFSCETKLLEYELKRMTQNGWLQFTVTLDGNYADVIAFKPRNVG